MRVCWGVLTILLVVGAAWAAPTAVQDAAPGDAPSAPLVQKQTAIRARLQSLESRMLDLIQALADREPDKAARLRDGLEHAGKTQLQTRLEAVVTLLDAGEIDAAEQAQLALIKDLSSMLEILTDTEGALDRQRAERERLEAIRAALESLAESQRELLYATREARQQLDDARASQNTEAEAAATQTLRQLEQQQLELRAATDALRRTMRGEDLPNARPAPGEPRVGQAGERMQAAADQLGEQDPAEADGEQIQALNELEQSLAELDDALRQIREQEREETLAALETRLRAILAREREVRDTVAVLLERGAANWTHADELSRADADELHHAVIEDARAVERILRDEGTTVIVPELVSQAIESMERVTFFMAPTRLSPRTLSILDDVIVQLERIMDAIAQQREKSDEPPRDGQQPAQQQPESKPLIARSAELRLLRAAQEQLNGQYRSLVDAAELDEASRDGEMRLLGRQQERLAVLTRIMHEQKPQ